MYRPATLQDVVDIKDTLREIDVREIYQMSGLSPEKGLGLSYLRSDIAWTMTYQNNDNVIGMIGVTPHNHNEDVGIPWMLCTPKVEDRKVQIALLKECKKHVDIMFDMYPVLTNYVHKDNKLAIRWLQWIGFEIRPLVIKLSGGDFLQFTGVRD